MDLCFLIRLTLYAGRMAGARQPLQPELPMSSLLLGVLCVELLDKRIGRDLRSLSVRRS